MKTSTFMMRIGMVVMVGLVLGAPLPISAQPSESSAQGEKQAPSDTSIAGPEGVAQKLKKAETKQSAFPNHPGCSRTICEKSASRMITGCRSA